MDTMTTTTTRQPRQAPPLTLRERCERCSAQAYTGWVHPDVTDDRMLFCAHHTAEHEPVLVAGGWHLEVDQRPDLWAMEQGPR
jgi:hypothetical protein